MVYSYLGILLQVDSNSCHHCIDQTLTYQGSTGSRKRPTSHEWEIKIYRIQMVLQLSRHELILRTATAEEQQASPYRIQQTVLQDMMIFSYRECKNAMWRKAQPTEQKCCLFFSHPLSNISGVYYSCYTQSTVNAVVRYTYITAQLLLPALFLSSMPQRLTYTFRFSKYR